MAKQKEPADKEVPDAARPVVATASVKTVAGETTPRLKPAKKGMEVADVTHPVAAIAPVKTVAVPTPQPKAAQKGKLLPKHKSRLPRKLKKAQKKAALLQ